MSTKPVFETVYSESNEVSCDGGEGALGHPKVYLQIGTKTSITCPYCSRQFVLKSKKKKD
jgi:uncharacterized Zn-finger protein